MLHTKRQPARIKEIIELVKQQEPERKDIIKSLKKCSGANGQVVNIMNFPVPKKEIKTKWNGSFTRIYF